MTIFIRPRTVWGRKPAEDAPPEPLATGPLARQCAVLPDALAVLEELPEEGQSLHCLMTGRYDLMQLVVALVERIGVVDAMRASTLSFHASNLAQLLALLDAGKVRRLDLLACTFWRNTNRGLHAQTLAELRQRGQRLAVARVHAKVVCLAGADGSRWALESSANLRSCDCWENLTIVRCTAVHDFHSGWIEKQVSAHEGDSATDDGAG
jgi:hypothetical protein